MRTHTSALIVAVAIGVPAASFVGTARGQQQPATSEASPPDGRYQVYVKGIT